MGKQMTDAGLWSVFEAAIDDIAQMLHEKNHRVDYANRRSSTANWRLPRDQWMELCAGISGLEQRGASGDPCVGEAIIWSWVNEASYLHSPTVTLRRSMCQAPDRIADEIGSVIRRQRPSFVALSRRLKLYADRLAKACDRGALHADMPTTADALLNSAYRSVPIR
ncbi:hypothetical protein ACFZA1_27855 [Streptomyces filipinensis]|uniref:hypothetical protein n=1 Tax=Streptomyces filipinensis TaxID=66887 RepID=UPI0036EE0558